MMPSLGSLAAVMPTIKVFGPDVEAAAGRAGALSGVRAGAHAARMSTMLRIASRPHIVDASATPPERIILTPQHLGPNRRVLTDASLALPLWHGNELASAARTEQTCACLAKPRRIDSRHS